MVFYQVCIGYRGGSIYLRRYSIGKSMGHLTHLTGYSIGNSIWYIIIGSIIEVILSGII